MPTLTIDRATRDVLWRDLIQYVLKEPSDDIVKSALQREVDDAARLGRRLRHGLRLMDDLGWDRLDARREFEITMDRSEVRQLLATMGSQAGAMIETDMEGQFDRSQWSQHPMGELEWKQHVEHEAEEFQHEQAVVAVCDSLLEEVA